MSKNVKDYFDAGVEKLINTSSWDKVHKQDIAAAAHLLMRYSLLDRLADAFEIPKQTNFIASGRRKMPHLTKNFERVSADCFFSAFRLENFLDTRSYLEVDRAHPPRTDKLQTCQYEAGCGGER
jgi:hypothetical protein